MNLLFPSQLMKCFIIAYPQIMDEGQWVIVSHHETWLEVEKKRFLPFNFKPLLLQIKERARNTLSLFFSEMESVISETTVCRMNEIIFLSSTIFLFWDFSPSKTLNIIWSTNWNIIQGLSSISFSSKTGARLCIFGTLMVWDVHHPRGHQSRLCIGWLKGVWGWYFTWSQFIIGREWYWTCWVSFRRN